MCIKLICNKSSKIIWHSMQCLASIREHTIPNLKERKTAQSPVSNDTLLKNVQDFLIKLDIKPLMRLLKISIFSVNKDILRLTKIMNNLVKDCKIRTFKIIFHCLKLVESFHKIFSVKNIGLGDQLLLMICFKNFTF